MISHSCAGVHAQRSVLGFLCGTPNECRTCGSEGHGRQHSRRHSDSAAHVQSACRVHLGVIDMSSHPALEPGQVAAPATVLLRGLILHGQ